MKTSAPEKWQCGHDHYQANHFVVIFLQVNRRLDDIGQKLLNKGFNIVEKFHGEIHKEVKSKLPRRESERRNHSLARHVDILAAVETRLSLLTMTFSKYIDMDLCCFIPGKVRRNE